MPPNPAMEPTPPADVCCRRAARLIAKPLGRREGDMGYKRILTVSEDDTREAEVSELAWEHLKGELGRAVLSLFAVQPIEIDELDRIEQNERYRRAMDAYTPKTLATIGNHRGAVRLVGREHSTWCGSIFLRAVFFNLSTKSATSCKAQRPGVSPNRAPRAAAADEGTIPYVAG